MLASNISVARERAEWSWADAAITGSLGNTQGLPSVAITRYLSDRVGFTVPNSLAVPCAEKGEDDWEFTLGLKSKVRFRRVPSLWMPEGEPFTPKLGALQVAFLFDEKPPTNVFPMRLTLPRNYFMWFQPALTQQEIDGIDEAVGPSYRPPWCVGSYALYAHDGISPAGGMVNLRKLGHFPRPWAKAANFDSEDPTTWTWGDWHWDPLAGTLAKVIPQKWLDTAKFPADIDDSFGKTGLGGSGTPIGADYIAGDGPYSPASDGTMDATALYANGDESGNMYTGGLYPSSGGSPANQTKIVDGGGGANANNDWAVDTMDSNPDIYAATAYFLGRNCDSNWDGLYDDTDGSVKVYYSSSAYVDGTLPATFPSGPSSLNRAYSHRGDYTPGGAAGQPTRKRWGGVRHAAVTNRGVW